MSNMLRQGKRLAAKKKKREVKGHTKEFYKILNELDDVAISLENDQTFMKEHFTEEGILEYAPKYTEIEIGNLEKMVLMGKLGMYEQMEQTIERVKDGTREED
jgi:hypothetical protein